VCIQSLRGCAVGVKEGVVSAWIYKFSATNDLASGMDTQLHQRALERTLIPLEARGFHEWPFVAFFSAF
jgi:hypothetical protein